MSLIAQISASVAWRGDQIGDGWKLGLSDVQRAELLAALATAEAADVPPDGVVAREAFPLPTLGPQLERLADDVARGLGFALVQGVPVAGLSERQCEIVALGLAGYIGAIVLQGQSRAPVMHVRDEGLDPSAASTRSYQHNQRLGFHADPTDVVALLCIRPARSGGLSAIVSSVAVHNEIVRTRPDLAQVLYQPWWFDRRSGDGPDSFFQSPVYTVDAGGRLLTRYGPDYLRSAQRGVHVPALSPLQLEAMDALDRLHEDPRFVLLMDLRAGDLQFLNNGVILHSRTGYEDHPEPECRRHLIRLWLNL